MSKESPKSAQVMPRQHIVRYIEYNADACIVCICGALIIRRNVAFGESVMVHEQEECFWYNCTLRYKFFVCYRHPTLRLYSSFTTYTAHSCIS